MDFLFQKKNIKCIHHLPEVHRNCSCKTKILSTFLALLFERACCSRTLSWAYWPPVTTGHQKLPKMGQNSIIPSFFARRGKKASAKGRSPPQEIEVGPRSGPYLLDHLNIVPSIFQHIHMYQGCCKNTKLTFHCIVVLQSKWQGPKWWKTQGQICPFLLTRIRTFLPGLEENYTLICWIYIFPTSLIYVGMLENCWHNISMFGCGPIQGTTYFFGEIQTKPGSQSGWVAEF